MARLAALPAAHHVLMRRLRRSLERRLRGDGGEAAPERSGGPWDSRADGSDEIPAASQAGGPMDSPANGHGDVLPASPLGASLKSRPDDSARRGFASRRMFIRENSRGRGLATLLLPHFKGASTVIVQDGYVRTQLERLRELAELARSAGVRRVEVVAKPWQPSEPGDADADATASDPLLALAASIGGIEWSVRTSTLHHDRQVQILRDGGGVTVDLGRGLDMYYAAFSAGETQANSDTLRARQTVVWTRRWTSREPSLAEPSKCRGTTAEAQDLATRPTRKLRRLAQRLRELARLHSSGLRLDAQQLRALQRRPAVELALSRRRSPGSGSPPSIGEAWTCPVPWCGAVNRSERLVCVYAARGCMGQRDPERFAQLWRAALRLQHFWRCLLHHKRASFGALAAARAVDRARRQRGLVTTDEIGTQTDLAPQAAPAMHSSESDGLRRKRPRAMGTAPTALPDNVRGWILGSAGGMPRDSDVERVLHAGYPRAPLAPLAPAARSLPLPRVEPEQCMWCGAPLQSGQLHVCGGAAAAQHSTGAARTPRERISDRPRGPSPLPVRQAARELCGWCGAPLVPGEPHICEDVAEEPRRTSEAGESAESL